MSPRRRVLRSLMGIPAREVKASRRGFDRPQDEVHGLLEQIGSRFLEGYHVAIEEPDLDILARRVELVPAAFRGFAFEGAGMALALLDRILPWRRTRFRRLVEGPGRPHSYLLHVGAGWAMARLDRGAKGPPTGLDPLLGWLTLDGFGFHEGYFHWPESVVRQARPRRLGGHAGRVFDQGLGRSLWFVRATDPRRIADSIAHFATGRRADLWSGVGLAATYAGGVDDAGLDTLATLAGAYLPELAQGAAFAAKARQRGDNMTRSTEAACAIFCGMNAIEAAALTDRALQDLPEEGDIPAYETWRRRIRDHWVREEVAR